MTRPDTKVPESATEVVLPGGCVLCGSDLPVRISRGEAVSVCSKCRWFSKPLVFITKSGVQVAHRPSGWA